MKNTKCILPDGHEYRGLVLLQDGFTYAHADLKGRAFTAREIVNALTPMLQSDPSAEREEFAREQNARDQIVEELARKFCELMCAALTPAQLVRVKFANHAETNPSVCHTHDYCDANEVMAEACDLCDVGADDTEIQQAAWDLAKKAQFDAEDI